MAKAHVLCTSMLLGSMDGLQQPLPVGGSHHQAPLSGEALLG